MLPHVKYHCLAWQSSWTSKFYKSGGDNLGMSPGQVVQNSGFSDLDQKKVIFQSRRAFPWRKIGFAFPLTQNWRSWNILRGLCRLPRPVFFGKYCCLVVGHKDVWCFQKSIWSLVKAYAYQVLIQVYHLSDEEGLVEPGHIYMNERNGKEPRGDRTSWISILLPFIQVLQGHGFSQLFSYKMATWGIDVLYKLHSPCVAECREAGWRMSTQMLSSGSSVKQLKWVCRSSQASMHWRVLDVLPR